MKTKHKMHVQQTSRRAKGKQTKRFSKVRINTGSTQLHKRRPLKECVHHYVGPRARKRWLKVTKVRFFTVNGIVYTMAIALMDDWLDAWRADQTSLSVA